MDEQQRSGFWSTLPGILTGAAALITAATGGYLAFDRIPHKAAAAFAPQSEAPAEPKPAAASPSQTASPAEARSAALADATPAGPDSPNLPATSLNSPRAPIASGDARPSFNCALASTVVETMVCSDEGLAARDQRVAAQYFALRGTLPAGVRNQLLQSQRLFLKQRADCRTSQCLSDLYDVRLRQLAEFASN